MSEWAIKKLSDIASVIDSLHKTPSYVSYGYPMVRVTDIKGGYLDLKGTLKVSETTYKEFSRKYKPKFGDLVFSRVGTYGLTSFVKDDTPFCLGQNTVFIVPNINCYFLFYFLTSPLGKNQIESFVSGSTQKTISLASINNIEVLTPSLEEQKRIADVLSCLDAKIENLRKQNNTLEQIAQTLFKHWFIDFEFPNTDGEPYKSSGGEMQSSVLGDIPKGWRVGKIGEEVETLGGGTPSTTEPSYWENGNIIWYSPTDLTSSKTLFSLGSDKKITKLGLSKSSAKLFPAYSLLLTSRATVGVITINTKPACTNQGFITIIPNKKYSVYFLHSWLLRQVKRIQLLASGSTFPEISKTDFRNLDFLIPKDDVLDNFQGTIKPIYRKIEINTQQIETLTKTRDALLPKLMSGQIRIEE